MDAQRLPLSTSTKQLVSSLRLVFHSSSEVNVSTCKIKRFKKKFPRIAILRLNRPQDAMKDAEMAKEFDDNSVKVIIAKAEAYYHMGQFERALGESREGSARAFV